MQRLPPAWILMAFPLALGISSAPAFACSCFGIMGIGTALTEAEIVVVGRVEGRSSTGMDSGSTDGFIYPDPIKVKVIKRLKGDVAGEIRITTDFMCYRSFSLEDFRVGETFVFPIAHTLRSGLHVLPGCSHSALKLMDGQLYTNDLVFGGGRRLNRYMSLTVLQLLLPIGVLDTRVQIALAGMLLLLLPMPITQRLRRRSAIATPARVLANPADSLRSVDVRTAVAIVWILLCAVICLAFVIANGDPMSLAFGGALTTACALAAAGLALRWRWTEGLSYGLVSLCIGACTVVTYWGLSEYLTLNEHVDGKVFKPLLLILMTIVAMLLFAAAVRRRFSPSAAELS
ncbi:MAG TPA: hypothetical protein VFP37_18390 [Steroidobacteraceae bacterium]|nr:hypothetical protein [Steroidobacteraceae bacterium]